ncbi:MAG: LptF/LptG family permease [Mucilaginibacter sp.]
MKKIHLLLLKSFIRPFLVTFLIVMFVLLMLFLFKYIDDLIGKGFEWYTIVELMTYASATNVQMALPLSVLLSSIMTYGSLGENYELVAIKSAGISLRRAMAPMLVVVAILSVAAFVFSDYMLPIANLKYFSLLYDARQQKSANFLPEGVFSNSFPGHIIRVQRKDPDGQTLYGIMIYSKNAAENNTDVLLAKSGLMYRTPNGMFLVLKLKDGVRYMEDKGANNFNYRQKLIRQRFKETEQKFDISSFKIHRTDENEFKQALQMMNLRQINDDEHKSRRQIDSSLQVNYKLITAYIKYFSIKVNPDSAKKYAGVIKGDKTMSDLKPYEQLNIIANASSEARSIQDLLKNRGDRVTELSKNVRRARLEFQKKFTLSAACIALFLIGAPLGAIIRKGGLGLPVVVSVIFFLIFYIISTIGEKAVKDGDLSPILGSWVAIAIITPIGMFLSYKAATDSVIFDMEAYKRFFNKLFKRKKVEAS